MTRRVLCRFFCLVPTAHRPERIVTVDLSSVIKIWDATDSFMGMAFCIMTLELPIKSTVHHLQVRVWLLGPVPQRRAVVLCCGAIAGGCCTRGRCASLLVGNEGFDMVCCSCWTGHRHL